MNRRILFVAMQNSVHLARWLDAIADKGWDIHLFAMDGGPYHPDLRNVILHVPTIRLRPLRCLLSLWDHPGDLRMAWRVFLNRAGETEIIIKTILPIPMISPFDRLINRLLPSIRTGESSKRVPILHGPRLLARLIRTVSPDLIHSMEFQHAGYLTLATKDFLKNDFPPWLATNWGSDIYHYGKFEDHRKQISRLLKNIDYYSCECERDIGLARELGLTGTVLPVFPNSGGFDLDHTRALGTGIPPSRRRLVAVKGYQHFAGRALTALDALERCADQLKGYEIVVYLASDEVAERVHQLARTGTLNIQAAGFVPHDQMLRMFGQARLYIGISVSDAISTSLLEAMVMGAFPIQTDTSCWDEWISDGESGFSVPCDDVDVIADRIRRALADDGMVDEAARINWQTAKDRLDKKIIWPKIEAFYDEIFYDLEEEKFLAEDHPPAPARTETMVDIFSRIHQQEAWGQGDSSSGAGSDMAQTEALRAALPPLLERLGVASILDIPCGDFNWMRHLDLEVDYVGADTVPEIIAANHERFGQPGRRFMVLDIIQGDLPDTDLIFCRDLFVHLSFADAFEAIENIKRTRSEYLLTTTFTARPGNFDVPTGKMWRPLNLQKAPFNFPAPLHVIDEECFEETGEGRSKSLGLWRILDL